MAECQTGFLENFHNFSHIVKIQKTSTELYKFTQNLPREQDLYSANNDFFNRLIAKTVIAEFNGKRYIVFPQIEITTTDTESSVKNFLSKKY